ncbi:MAG: hypothetical protein MUC56_06215 [Thermoanaerobaculales bacterium]|nr:hypothetical protein [Thermoanaerobaculales bacterium]
MIRTATTLMSCAITTMVAVAPAPSAAQVPSSSGGHPVLVLQVGDIVPGARDRSVVTLSGPESAGGDHVGFALVLSGGEGALWVGHPDGRPERLILSRSVGASWFYTNRFGVAAEPPWGTADGADLPFAVKARMSDGRRTILTGWGLAQVIGAGAPGLPAGATVSDVRRLSMLLDGEAAWVASWSAQGRTGTALYHRSAGPKAEADLLLITGDPACGAVLGELRNFRVAPNRRRGQAVELITDQGPRDALLLDGECPLAVGRPLPGGAETPTEILFFDVNSAGRVLLGAITDAPSNRNAVFVLDGRVVMREGEVIDGVHLAPSSAQPNQARLDDLGRAVTLWAGPPTSRYTIFYTPDVDDFASTRALVTEGASLDLNGDGSPDATLEEFRFFPDSGPTFSLGETGIHIAVKLRYPGSPQTIDAVIFQPF